MRLMSTRLALAVCVAGFLAAAGSSSDAALPTDAVAAETPRATLAVLAYFDHTSAGLPILLELSITNTGPTPFHYVCAGPGRYPSARPFTATVVGPDRQPFDVPLTNGQYEQATFAQVPAVQPGATVRLPVALAVPGPGTYTIRRIRGEAEGESATSGRAKAVTWPAMAVDANLVVRVIVDPAGSVQFAADWLARVRANEGFARHVAVKYHVPGVAAAMVADLGSDDPEVVIRAADIASAFDNPRPDGLGDGLRRAAARWSRGESPNFDVLSHLLSTATQDGSDASLDAALAIVGDARVREQERWVVVELASFRQPRAGAALRRLLADPDRVVQFAAATGLSKRLDPAAVPVLIAASRDPADPNRHDAFARLADYLDDPRAAAAIKAGVADPDPAVSFEAAKAQAQLDEARARRAKIVAEEAAAATQPVPATRPAAGTGGSAAPPSTTPAGNAR